MEPSINSVNSCHVKIMIIKKKVLLLILLKYILFKKFFFQKILTWVSSDCSSRSCLYWAIISFTQFVPRICNLTAGTNLDKFPELKKKKDFDDVLSCQSLVNCLSKWQKNVQRSSVDKWHYKCLYFKTQNKNVKL